MGHFESEAAGNFAISSGEIAQLRTIHENESGIGKGRRHLEVLNKSGIVLLCAIWEAYCEDVADEALNNLLAHLRDPSGLPESLRKRIAKELMEEDLHELSPWKLAGDTWKSYLRQRLTSLRQQRNREWSNPNSAGVDKFFDDALGLKKISDSWHWWRVNARMARHKLDLIVTLRGDIAHRGRTLRYVEKYRVSRALNHVRKLVEVTDAKVARELKLMTKVEPWSGK